MSKCWKCLWSQKKWTVTCGAAGWLVVVAPHWSATLSLGCSASNPTLLLMHLGRLKKAHLGLCHPHQGPECNFWLWPISTGNYGYLESEYVDERPLTLPPVLKNWLVLWILGNPMHLSSLPEDYRYYLPKYSLECFSGAIEMMQLAPGRCFTNE